MDAVREGSTFSILSIKVLRFTSSQLSAIKAAPKATKYLEFSGKITSSGLSPNVSVNLFLSSDMYVRGPPRKATFPFILCPHARPLMV